MSGYMYPGGRKGVDVAPFRKMFLDIVRHAGSAHAAGILCGFGSTALAYKVMKADRIEHTSGRKILDTWRRLKAEGAFSEQQEAA